MADDPLNSLAVGIDADHKASKRKGGKAALAAGAAHLSKEGAEESLSDALASLGSSVAAQPDAGTEGYDLSEKAHTTAIERMERMASDATFNSRTMVWEVRDFLLDQIKSRPKPWSGTSNAEQRDVAASCEHAATELVRKIVEQVMLNGQEGVRVLLTKVTLGEDIVIAGKVKVVEEGDEDKAVAMLHHARGKHVMVTLASVADFNDNQTEAETDPDQHGLGFEAGSDDLSGPDGDDDLNPEE